MLKMNIYYFSNWSGKDLKHIVLNCFTQEYNPNSVITGNVIGVTDNIYFVFSGTCEIVRVSQCSSNWGYDSPMARERAN